MTATLAYVGGALLTAATLPQVVRLLRTRSAHDFGWAFTALNFVGLTLFAYRSWELKEWGFFGVNVLTSAFWGLVLGVKVATRPRADAAARALVPLEPSAPQTRDAP